MKRKAELVPATAPDTTPKHNPLLLPNWMVTQTFLADATDTEPRRYIINAEYLIRPEACIYCGVVGRLHSQSGRAVRVRYTDAPLHGRPVQIAVLKKSFECQECKESFRQELPHMEPGRFMTQRCADLIAEWSVMWTCAEIARQVNLDESIARAIKGEEDQAFETSYNPEAPIALGIDELTIGGERRLVLTDIAGRRVLDLLKDMEGSSLGRWLTNLPNRDRIRIVVSDMHVPYHRVVRAMLPDAILIMDKWHVQKGILERLDDVRNRGMREEKEAKKAARAAARAAGELMKPKPRAVPRKKGEPRPATDPWKSKRLLAKHRETITSPKTLFALDGILANYPLLRDAHECKERFYAIWKAEDRADAEARFEAWASSIPASVAPEFTVVASTIRELHGPVFAYFDHRYTAAYTEGANGLIKILNRAGRGYRMSSIRRKAILMPRRSKDRPGICEKCLHPIADLNDAASFEVHDFGFDDEREFIICAACGEDLQRELDAFDEPFTAPGAEDWFPTPVDVSQHSGEDDEGDDPIA